MSLNNECILKFDAKHKKMKFENEKGVKRVKNAEIQREKMAALGQLAGGIAHDFNNQLMSIIGNATMIQKTEDVEKIRDYAQRIIHISQSTAKLTKKILLFSRKESNVNEPIDLKLVLDNTYTMMDSIINKKINLKYRYEASNYMIMGNESQIESLIINLIINSRDSMEDESGNLSVSAEDVVILSEFDLSHGEIIKPGTYIKVTIEDDGMGMTESTFNKIFEPYFTTKNKSKGTGLGLSVVFGTVKAHSGYINVRSKLNIGTSFEIYFPILETKDGENENSVGKLDTKGNLIMLVDDDINVLEVEAELLDDMGYEVEKFNNPFNALEYYEKAYENISFVILDIVMPGINGAQLYEELQRINKDVTVIFISGYSGQKEYKELIDKGAIIVDKPFAFSELSMNIAKLYK